MKQAKAILILAVPFAITCLLLLSGMCLTPYWECRYNEAVPIAEIVVPSIFLLSIFVCLALVVLYVVALLIAKLNTDGMHRSIQVASMGSATALVPYIFFTAYNGQGMGALNPQLEYLPFLITGGVFSVVLDRLIIVRRSAHEV